MSDEMDFSDSHVTFPHVHLPDCCFVWRVTAGEKAMVVFLQVLYKRFLHTKQFYPTEVCNHCASGGQPKLAHAFQMLAVSFQQVLSNWSSALHMLIRYLFLLFALPVLNIT